MYDKRTKDIGAHVLEAPITGGLEALKKGQMVVFTGGDEEVATAMKPLLDASVVVFCSSLTYLSIFSLKNIILTIVFKVQFICECNTYFVYFSNHIKKFSMLVKLAMQCY